MATNELSDKLRQVVLTICDRVQRANTDELAKALGISKSNLYRIRRGGSPSLGTLELLADYFDKGEQPHRQPQHPLVSMPDKGPAKPPTADPPASLK